MPRIEDVLTSILKVGLRAAVPIIGDMLVTAIDEGASLLLGVNKEKKDQDLFGRLLREMKAEVKALKLQETTSTEVLNDAVSTAELVLSNHGIRPGEWSTINFDAEKATNLVWDRAKIKEFTLDDESRRVCRVLVKAFYSAFGRDRDALLQTEQEYRSAVLNRLDSLPNKISSLSSEAREIALGVAASALIAIPRRVWSAEYSPPGALLRPDYDRAVPFHGRQRELIELNKWCSAKAGIAVRLYTGAGGMGKTRLFIELCSRLTSVGWHAGFLSTESARASAEVWQTLSGRWPEFLVVIDYAETRREELISLFRAVDRSQQMIEQKKHRFRIVLLARAADDWWETMKAQGDGVGELLRGPATTKHRLLPLAMTREERRDSYSKALTAFADALGSAKRSELPSDLSADHYERVLLLHMSALAAIEGVEVKGDQGILDYTLGRERRYWTERAAAKGLPKVLEPGIVQGMATVTLGGGVNTRGEAVDLLKKIPLLQDQTRIVLTTLATLLHESYPGEKFIEPLLPDLLGEHLVQVALEDEPDALLELVLRAPGSD